MKEMLLWVKRIHVKNDGNPQWHDEKAEIFENMPNSEITARFIQGDNIYYVIGARDIPAFLNGVCRHEQLHTEYVILSQFLNGVCRHEQYNLMRYATVVFLNGVCRHERN